MRFILMVKATEYSEAGVNHGRKYSKAVMAYKRLLAEAGVLLAAEEIQPSSTGLRITYSSSGGEPECQAGPFPVEQALISEYFLIEVDTEQEALNWALQLPVPEKRGETSIELRRIEEMPISDKKPNIGVREADLHNPLAILRGWIG